MLTLTRQLACIGHSLSEIEVLYSRIINQREGGMAFVRRKHKAPVIAAISANRGKCKVWRRRPPHRAHVNERKAISLDEIKPRIVGDVWRGLPLAVMDDSTRDQSR